VDDEFILKTETHHEIKRDRNFLNGIILLKKIFFPIFNNNNIININIY